MVAAKPKQPISSKPQAGSGLGCEKGKMKCQVFYFKDTYMGYRKSNGLRKNVMGRKVMG